ncbi:MAG: hypothetical protein U0228_30480 [Myxococcaceae bacterium]
MVLPEPSLQILRELVSGWPRATPESLLRSLHQLDRALGPHVRKGEWAPARALVTQRVSALASEFPACARMLRAHEAAWLSTIELELNNAPAAIAALKLRLTHRWPKTAFRKTHYLSLVSLLRRSGQVEAGQEFASRARRHYARRDPEFVRLIDQLLK